MEVKTKMAKVLHLLIKLTQARSELQIILIYKAWGETQPLEYCLLKDFWDILFLARIYKTVICSLSFRQKGVWILK